MWLCVSVHRKLVPAGWGETLCESTPCSLTQESISRLYCKAVCNLEICREKKQRHINETHHCLTEVISHYLLNSPNETNIGIDNESSVFMFRLRKFALPPGIVSAIFWQLAKMLSTISSFVCTHLATVTWLQIKILFYDSFNISTIAVKKKIAVGISFKVHFCLVFLWYRIDIPTLPSPTKVNLQTDSRLLSPTQVWLSLPKKLSSWACFLRSIRTWRWASNIKMFIPCWTSSTKNTMTCTKCSIEFFNEIFRIQSYLCQIPR